MSTLSLRLPDSIHEKVKELAARDDISVNQFIATAVAEKMAALLTVEYLADRAERGDESAMDRILNRVPSRPPLDGDELNVTNEKRKPSRPSKSRRSSRSKH